MTVPSPKEWILLDASSKRDDKHRTERNSSTRCSHYSKCLDYVVAKGWRGWTCYYCDKNPLGRKRKNEPITS